ncbi:DUF7544 domain-containing protein [Natronosalvus rutilus]|uniref:DUF4013 domain-containing protein n=1 Tax=Natronosalvus rutilus TaxID=2953753 RepID=A0A9E7N8M7_9EURY|nr:hypothetical protein [Natronosalvus rutilus]UTF53460.1 hypothetical protein NGM29_17085 [Natronosalvus rutilus]
MYAIDDLGDAIDVTRDRLTPIDAGTWLKLALILFFIGGATFGGPGAPSTGTDTAPEGATGTDIDSLADLEAEYESQVTDGPLFETVLYAVAALVVGLFLLWLLYVLVGSIMEFVFIESLRTEAVEVRRYTRSHLGDGLRLFGFRLALLLALLVPLVVPIVYVVASVTEFSAGLAALGALYVFGAIVLGLAYALVNRFTTIFVTQIMVLEDRGVLAAWSRFLPTLRSNLAEYAVYVILVWILQLVVSFGYGILAAIVAVVVAIPFVVVGAIFVVVGGPAIYLAVLVGIVGLLCIFLAALLLRVPIDSYFRYYGFLLLGDTSPDLDLIPERRNAVRTGGPVGPGSGSSGGSDGDDWNDSSAWDDDANGDDDGWRFDSGSDDDEDRDQDQDRGW